MVEGAALEMLCGETHLGFESLTLRTWVRSVGCGLFSCQYERLPRKREPSFGMSPGIRGSGLRPLSPRFVCLPSSACQANRLAATSSEASAAEHGTILTGLEGNLGGLTAFGAHSVEHLAGSAGSGTGRLASHTAVTAAGGLILEALLGVERLFTGRENELIAAVFAYQRLVFVHGLEPPEKN